MARQSRDEAKQLILQILNGGQLDRQIRMPPDVAVLQDTEVPLIFRSIASSFPDQCPTDGQPRRKFVARLCQAMENRILTELWASVGSPKDAVLVFDGL